MKKGLRIIILCLLTLPAFAQEYTDVRNVTEKKGDTENKDTVGWVYKGDLAIGANQALLHNWAAGGELASAVFNGVFTGNLTYYHKRSLWSNNLDAAYGLLYAYSNSFVPRKTDDRIDLTSKYGYRLHPEKDLYFVFLANFRTQFTKGFDYSVPEWDTFSTSRFLSPLYITLAPGLEYRKGTVFSIFFSPAAARFTFVDKYYTARYPEGAFGVENGKSARVELGAYLQARFQKDFTPNLTFKSRLDLYSNYLAKDVYDDAGMLVKKNNPGNIDILWDNFLAVKVGKFFSVNVGLTAIYDNDIPYYKTYLNDLGQEVSKDEPLSGLGWLQIKQILNVGFNYKF